MKPYKINLFALIFFAMTIFLSAIIGIVLSELKVEKGYSITLLVCGLLLFLTVFLCYKKRKKVVYSKRYEKFNYYAMYFFYLPLFAIAAVFITIVSIKHFFT